MIRRIPAFLRKDFLVEKSYRFAFLLGIFSTLFSLLIFFFIDRLFGREVAPYLEELKINYFSYVFVATLLFNYTGAGLGSISEKIRTEKVQGTFEGIANNEGILPPFVVSVIIYNFALTSLETVLYLAAGFFFLGLDFSNVNLLSLALTLFLSALSFSSIGIVSSCFIILFRKGNPLAFLLNSMEGLFGGVYFPVAVLPLWAQFVSKLLPVYYAINAAQKSFYLNASPAQIWKELAALALFSAVLFPFSLWLLKKSVDRSRLKGTLGRY